jgi:hypothetical protein
MDRVGRARVEAEEMEGGESSAVQHLGLLHDVSLLDVAEAVHVRADEGDETAGAWNANRARRRKAIDRSESENLVPTGVRFGGERVKATPSGHATCSCFRREYVFALQVRRGIVSPGRFVHP